jgi:hypothetical protein
MHIYLPIALEEPEQVTHGSPGRVNQTITVLTLEVRGRNAVIRKRQSAIARF